MKKTSKKKTSKKTEDLPLVLRKILNLLIINPTTKYIIKKTKKDKRTVARDLIRLIDKGYIKRLERGVFKVLKSPKAVLPRHQPKHFRLHNLELELNVTSSTHKIIKGLVIKNSQFYNLRPFGNAGSYFDMNEVTGLITKGGIFLFYPEAFEITGSTRKILIKKLYDVIEKTARKWESKFKLHLFKDGKINFNIRNIHVAYIEGDLVREFQKKDITHLVIHDKEDSKPRFVIDMSKGFPEFEMVHPEKALDDTKEVEFWSGTLANGSYRDFMEDLDKNLKPALSDMFKNLIVTHKLVNELAQGQLNTNTQLQSVISLISPVKDPDDAGKDKQTKIPEYIG